MKKLQWLLLKARNSSFYLWILNTLAARFVPFNKPHGFKIVRVSELAVEVSLPYKRNNLNHIQGIHACALATLCEYATGLVLLSSLDAAQFRIILKNINITYHFQAKEEVYAPFSLDQHWLKNNVLLPLETQDAIFAELTVEVFNLKKEHICTGLINWQVKAWKNVKTK
jgi:acyl-coenzyme A thioesterase PaaI-like protein